MLRLLLVSPAKYFILAESRFFRPLFWELWLRGRLSRCSDEDFLGMLPSSGETNNSLTSLHNGVRLRFFFHPRNQKDFFLNLLTKTQDEESILSEAKDVLDNKFDTLGSGKIHLGDRINWHRDFKSGKTWEVRSPWRLDLMDRGNASDVKVPWELSRFHQVWWLGKAYWLTRSEQYAKKFAELVEGWIEANPVGKGVNWANAMEVSIRAMNWLAGYYFFCESKTITDEFWIRYLKSLYAHGVFVRNHLEETWRNENHMVSAVVGLIGLGIFFRSTGFGKAWLAWGIKNLEKEMNDQVRPDGVDYEQSTSYQRLVTELFSTAAILCAKNNITLTPGFMQRLERMFEFVLSYTRPDGSVPLIGDADDGRLFRFQSGAEINDHRHLLCVGAILFKRGDFKHAAGKFHQDALWLLGGEGFERYQMVKAESRDPGSRSFPEGGYYIMRSQHVHLIADAGDIGTGGMGGHGHNDTLSFEYWVHDEPLIVDSGTYAYTSDTAARQEFRRGRSHNTIVVDGKEIARFAGLWLIVSDRTRPHVSEWLVSPERDVLEAAHFAYDTLSGSVVHRRRFNLEKSAPRLHITDYLEGVGGHRIQSFLHFAPNVQLEIVDAATARARTERGKFNISTDGGRLEMVKTWFSRSYGVRENNLTLELDATIDCPRVITTVVSPA